MKYYRFLCNGEDVFECLHGREILGIFANTLYEAYKMGKAYMPNETIMTYIDSKPNLINSIE